MTKKTMNIQTLLIFILVELLIFQNWLQIVVPFLKMLDEIVAVIGLAFYFFKILMSGKMLKSDIKILIPLIISLLLGLTGNLSYGIQSSRIAIMIDVVSTFKFIFVFLGYRAMMDSSVIKVKKLIRWISAIMKVYVLILSGFAAVNLFKSIGMDAGMRYGIRMFAFVYGTPGHLINQMTYALLIFTAEREQKKHGNITWLLLCFWIMLLTVKTRALVLAAIYIGLYYVFLLREKKRLGMEILGIVSIGILIGYSQFKYYFLGTATPRQTFVTGAIKLVKEYFPLGTGFATYGSSAAADYYSPLYYALGFDLRYGMGPTSNMFLDDNFWPMIFAQLGLFGAFVFIVLLIYYVANILINSKKCSSGYNKLISYFFIFDIILGSVQSSYLAHYSMVTLSLLYMLLFYKDNRSVGNGYRNDGITGKR